MVLQNYVWLKITKWHIFEPLNLSNWFDVKYGCQKNFKMSTLCERVTRKVTKFYADSFEDSIVKIPYGLEGGIKNTTQA